MRALIIDNETGNALSDAELDLRFRDATNHAFGNIEFGMFTIESAEALFRISRQEYEKQKREWILYLVDETSEFSIKVR